MSEFPTSDLSDRGRQIINEALALPAEERRAFLEKRCGDDKVLFRQLEAILALEERGAPPSQTIDPSTAQASPAPQLIEAKPPPKEIGPYKMLEQIGEGGFGTVWLAEQSTPVRRRVAIKIIKLGMDSRAIVARFEQERQALAIMDHPNIAKVLDAGTAPDGRPYFVMEYVAGEAITKYCDKNMLSVKDRLDLFTHVCEAVQHAHHKGIIHRDIKPSNILVTVASGKPDVKIIDFGVAKALSHTLTDKTIFTEHGQILGTPEYMSPEQAEMGIIDIDTRTDVYSLGVVLYELLTGAVPFEPRELRSKGYGEIQRIIREVDPPRPSTKLRSLGGERSADIAQRRHLKLAELEGQLRRELEWIPLKAMRKDRQERYATPIAMADDIRNHLAGRPLLAGPESAIYRARKFVTRNKAPVTAVAAILAAIVAGGILSTVGFVRAAQQRDRADAEAKRATEEASRLRQVNAYVTSMLASANPASGDRKDVTVRELLDDAVRKLDGGSLKDMPRNEAALRRIIGLTYRSLSLWDKAEPQLRKAVEMETAAAGANSAEAAVAMTGLGQVYTDINRPDDAAKMLQQALTIQRVALKADDFHLGDTMANLAELSRQRGDFKSAEAQFREALAIYQKNPQDQPRIADSLANLAAVLHASGDTKQAIELTRQSLSIRRKTSGEQSVDVWNSLTNFASLLEAADDLAGAEQSRREALTLARTLFDEKHRNVIVSLGGLARVLWLRGGAALNEAEQIGTSALDLARTVEGEQSASYARRLDLLANIARDRQQFDRAIDLHRQALLIRRTTLKGDNPEIAASMSNLADVLTRGGKDPNEAIELASAALNSRKAIYQQGHWAIFASTSVLGGAYTAAGQFDKAEPLLVQAYDGLKAAQGVNGRVSVDAAGRLVTLYEKWGKMDEAGRWKQVVSDLSKPAGSP